MKLLIKTQPWEYSVFQAWTEWLLKRKPDQGKQKLWMIFEDRLAALSRIYPEWLLSILPELQLEMERLLKKAPQARGFFIVLL